MVSVDSSFLSQPIELFQYYALRYKHQNYNEMYKGSRTKAFTPIPLGLVVIRNFFFSFFFRLKIAGNGFCFVVRQLNTIRKYTNINISTCRLKQNIFNYSMATNKIKSFF